MKYISSIFLNWCIGILFLLTIFLTSCAITPKPPQVVEVKIPVIVKCIENLPVKPAFKKDAELLLLNNAQFVTALHIDRLQRDAYIAELEAVIEGCK